MAIPVIMPKTEMSQETATVIEWLKQEGEPVEQGEPLLTVETDKVTVDIESPGSGILAGIKVEPQQVVPVTDVIAYLLQPGEELHPETDDGPPALSEKAAPAPASRPVSATPVAQQVASAHGLNLAKIEGTGEGGRITKADVETVLSSPARLTPAPAVDKVRATPAARRLARERGVELATLTGSGPRGRIQAADVPALAAVPAISPTAETIPLQGIRRTIAERMTASYQTVPHITLAMRVDMSAFETMRQQFNAQADNANGHHVSATVLMVKAVAWALKRHPWLNSTLRDEVIHLLPEINIGVAVAIEDGLIVPVVRQADQKGIAEMAVEVNDLTTRARAGQLTPGDVAGGTFTVSNLGPFGVHQFTAIINPPQAAILATGVIQPEPIVGAENQVVVRPIMHMTLSADHRIVDGAIAAHFLSDLHRVLEKPPLLLW